MQFKDKVVVITGGGSGIGFSAAKLFAAAGAAVAINDVRREAAAEAAAEIAKSGASVIAIPGDVSQESEIHANVKNVIDRFGRIDVLVSNAGIPISGPAEDYTQWRRSVAVNLDGMFYWAQSVAKQSMIPNKSGSIVMTSSLAGLAAMRNDIGYVTCKHGIVGMTKGLAVEWAKFGIRVNCIAPGLTDSLMVRQHMPVGSDAFRNRVARIPLGRLGQPEDQAKVILFLASDDAAYVTGHTVPVDGGQMALHSGMI